MGKTEHKGSVDTLTINGVDVSGLEHNIEIIEDFYSYSVTATISIIDGINIMDDLFDETCPEVSIAWSSILNEGVVGTAYFNGYIVKLAQRYIIKRDLVRYVFHAVTKEVLINEITRFSKSYKGTISEIAAEIFEEHIGGSLITESTKSDHKHKIIVPYWTPFYAINWLASRAVKESNDACDFSFFQDLDGQFHFESLDKLIESDGSSGLGTLFQYEGNRPGGDVQSVFAAIEDMNLINATDTLDRLMSNMYSGTLIRHDISTKRIMLDEFKYTEYDNNRVESSKFEVKTKPAGNLEVDKFKKWVKVYPQHKGIFGEEFYYKPEERGRWAENWAYQRQSAMMGQTAGMRYQIISPGDANRRVGDVIEIETLGGGGQDCPFMGGKWVTTCAVHFVNSGQRYRTAIEITRNGKV